MLIYNFMLDEHGVKRPYEVITPYIIAADSMLVLVQYLIKGEYLVKSTIMSSSYGLQSAFDKITVLIADGRYQSTLPNYGGDLSFVQKLGLLVVL